MRFFYLLLFLLSGHTTFAQDFVFPKLVKQVSRLQQVAPAGWRVIDTAVGDLNNDKLEDLALILEYQSNVREKRAYGDNTTEIITENHKPRILVVYFRAKGSRNYLKSVQNNDFVLRNSEGGSLGNPLRSLAIENNKMKMVFEGGGEWRWKLNYGFRYMNSGWYLAEAGNLSYHNGSGEMIDHQYDFVAKKQTTTKGNLFERAISSEAKEQEIKISRLRTFDTFKKPWTWEIGPDELL